MKIEFKLYFDVLMYNLIEIISPQQLKPIERKTTDTNMGKALAGLFGIVFVSFIGLIVKHLKKSQPEGVGQRVEEGEGEPRVPPVQSYEKE